MRRGDDEVTHCHLLLHIGLSLSLVRLETDNLQLTNCILCVKTLICQHSSKFIMLLSSLLSPPPRYFNIIIHYHKNISIYGIIYVSTIPHECNSRGM